MKRKKLSLGTSWPPIAARSRPRTHACPPTETERHTDTGDIYVAAFEPEGTNPWTLVVGGEGAQNAVDVAVHPSGRLCITGEWAYSFLVGCLDPP